jgi:hypothetical protein
VKRDLTSRVRLQSPVAPSLRVAPSCFSSPSCSRLHDASNASTPSLTSPLALHPLTKRILLRPILSPIHHERPTLLLGQTRSSQQHLPGKREVPVARDPSQHRGLSFFANISITGCLLVHCIARLIGFMLLAHISKFYTCTLKSDPLSRRQWTLRKVLC